MDINLLNYLRDPIYGTHLRVKEDKYLLLKDAELIKGSLISDESTICYDVIDGIPIFLFKDKNWSIKRDGMISEFDYTYKEISVKSNILRDNFYNWRMKTAIHSFHPNHSDKVLNIGCYNCLETMILKKYSPFVVSTDIEFNILKTVYNFSKKENNFNFSLVCCDCEWLPFPDEFFDYVLLRQTLHHMPNLSNAIKEIFRVTKIGGKVVILSEGVFPITELIGLFYSSSNYYRKLWMGLRKIKHRLQGKEIQPTLPKGPMRSDRFLYLPYILLLIRLYSNNVTLQIPQGKLILNSGNNEIDINWNEMEVDADSLLKKIMPKWAWYKGEIDLLITKTRNRKIKRNRISAVPVSYSELPFMTPEDEAKAYEYLKEVSIRIETDELCI